jgi:hypothetical protein
MVVNILIVKQHKQELLLHFLYPFMCFLINNFEQFTSKKKLCIKNAKKIFITVKNFFNIVEGFFISQYLLTHLLQCPPVYPRGFLFY